MYKATHFFFPSQSLDQLRNFLFTSQRGILKFPVYEKFTGHNTYEQAITKPSHCPLGQIKSYINLKIRESRFSDTISGGILLCNYYYKLRQHVPWSNIIKLKYYM